MYQAPELAQNSPNLTILLMFRYFLGLGPPGSKKTIAVLIIFGIFLIFTMNASDLRLVPKSFVRPVPFGLNRPFY
jgi:hypothetical protein